MSFLIYLVCWSFSPCSKQSYEPTPSETLFQNSLTNFCINFNYQLSLFETMFFLFHLLLFFPIMVLSQTPAPAPAPSPSPSPHYAMVFF